MIIFSANCNIYNKKLSRDIKLVFNSLNYQHVQHVKIDFIIMFFFMLIIIKQLYSYNIFFFFCILNLQDTETYNGITLHIE